MSNDSESTTTVHVDLTAEEMVERRKAAEAYQQRQVNAVALHRMPEVHPAGFTEAPARPAVIRGGLVVPGAIAQGVPVVHPNIRPPEVEAAAVAQDALARKEREAARIAHSGQAERLAALSPEDHIRELRGELERLGARVRTLEALLPGARR